MEKLQALILLPRLCGNAVGSSVSAKKCTDGLSGNELLIQTTILRTDAKPFLTFLTAKRDESLAMCNIPSTDVLFP